MREIRGEEGERTKKDRRGGGGGRRQTEGEGGG